MPNSQEDVEARSGFRTITRVGMAIAALGMVMFVGGVAKGGDEQVCAAGSLNTNNLLGDQEFIDCVDVHPLSRDIMQDGMFVLMGGLCTTVASGLLGSLEEEHHGRF